MSLRVQIVTNRFDPISASIRFTTRSWASHAEFVDTKNGFTFGARSEGGVRERSSSRDHYSHIEQFVPNSPDHDHIIQAAFNWALGQEGKPYDYSAIFGILSDRNIHDDRKWFCSELIYVAFEQVGFPILSTRPSAMPWRITPRDLLLSRQLTYIPTS